MMIRLSILLALSLCLLSCVDQDAEDDQIIMDYLMANNLTADKTADGIYYIIDTPGNSQKPTKESTVTVNYTAYFLDADTTEFDSASNEELGLGQVIEGWKLALPLLGKEGSGTFFIPSGYAYGSSGEGTVPGNTAIRYDITLIDFK